MPFPGNGCPSGGGGNRLAAAYGGIGRARGGLKSGGEREIIHAMCREYSGENLAAYGGNG